MQVHIIIEILNGRGAMQWGGISPGAHLIDVVQYCYAKEKSAASRASTTYHHQPAPSLLPHSREWSATCTHSWLWQFRACLATCASPSCTATSDFYCRLAGLWTKYGQWSMAFAEMAPLLAQWLYKLELPATALLGHSMGVPLQFTSPPMHLSSSIGLYW